MKVNLFERQSHFQLVIILLFLAFFMLMFGNNIVSLTHPDEVFYVQTAKEMVQHHKWFTPMIFDGVQFEKPFLSFALIAAAIKWFGLTPFAARFWPAFFGIVGVGVVYWIAFLMFRKKRQAFLSALVLCTSFIYLALSRSVLTDMIFSVLVTISIGFYYLGYSVEKHKNLGVIFGFVFAGLAVLTKGLLGFLFPWMTIFFFLVYRRDLRFVLQPVFLFGFGLFLLIALPWHIAMYQAHGQWFLEEYFGNVHMRRILESEHPKIDTWYFYIGLMFSGVLPWSLFWIPGLKHIVDQFRRKTNESKAMAFLLGWMLAIFILVESAHSKLASYAFPIFPSISIILGFYLNKALESAEEGKRPRGLVLCGYAMSGLLVAVSGGIIIAGKINIDYVVNMRPVYVFSVLILVVAFLIFIFNKKRKYTQMLLSYAGINIALLVMLFMARPYIEPWVSCKDISEVLNRIDHSDTTVLASKFYVRGVRFYTDRKMAVIDINGKGFWSPHPIPFLNTDQKVLDFLAHQETTYAVVKEGNVEDLYRITKNRPYHIEKIDGIGGKYILKIDQIKE